MLSSGIWTIPRFATVFKTSKDGPRDSNSVLEGLSELARTSPSFYHFGPVFLAAIATLSQFANVTASPQASPAYLMAADDAVAGTESDTGIQDI